MLPGIRIKELKRFPDERGSFTEIFRNDWKDFIDDDLPLQANFSFSYPGMIRAWHRHHLGQVDYFLCIRGSIKICGYDDRKESSTKGELTQIISSSQKLQVVRMPGYYWHGFKNISDESAVVVYFTTRLYNYQKPDEERRPWNDPTIIDSLTGKPFDWNKPPHQ